MNETRLIVNADDFGMSRGICDAVLIAHRFGIVTSASMMMNMPATEYAFEVASRAPNLGVGIHLNLCAGKPVLPPEQVPSLVDADGSFHPPGAMRRKLWMFEASGREIEMEWRAQIQRMKSRGFQPSHADSHQHTHIYPGAALPFARAIRAEGIACVRASRCACWPRKKNWRQFGGPHEGSLSRRVLVQMYRGTLQRTIFRGFDSPESRVSFLPGERGDLERLGDTWKATIERLPQGTFEFTCHPGFFESGFSEADPIHLQREAELHWLASPDLRRVIERRGIQLISYDDLGGSSASKREAVEAAVT
ncbi:MAG TPA: ChbG/HpnK family deacetylase [Candidatus Sulfotelmatobacter sp.]|nr:ChbG/HpnK family deacetylase [Candidatus Sulfotelmatobacter sp.]